MTIVIKQGEDLLVNVPILDRANNTVDLTTATKIRAALVVRKLVVYKYQDSTLEAPITSYGTLNVNMTNTSSIDILLTREQSVNFPIGELSCYVLAEFPDAILNGKAVEYETILGKVEAGMLKSEDLTL